MLGVSVGTGTDTEVIVVRETLSVVSSSVVDGSNVSELNPVVSGGGGGAIVGAVLGIEDGDVDEDVDENVDGNVDEDVDGAAVVVSVVDDVDGGVVVVDGFGYVVDGVGEGVGVGVGMDVELGVPPHPCIDGTASGPLPISTRLIPQLAA